MPANSSIILTDLVLFSSVTLLHYRSRIDQYYQQGFVLRTVLSLFNSVVFCIKYEINCTRIHVNMSTHISILILKVYSVVELCLPLIFMLTLSMTW